MLSQVKTRCVCETLCPPVGAFDHEEWPWPWWHVTHENVHLNEMQLHAKYQVTICNRWNVMVNVKEAHFLTSIWPLTLKYDLDLDMSPIKLCVLVRWIQMPNIKLLSAIGEKLWPLLKLHVFDLQFDLEVWPWPWHVTH